MTKTATLITSSLEEMEGDAALYRLDPPIDITHYDYYADENTTVLVDHVIASGVDWRMGSHRIHECLIFPATPEGKVVDWSEIAGRKGTTSHSEVLATLDYLIDIRAITA